MADDAGALLVRSGLVTPSALEEARSRVDADGGTIGEQLVVAGAITDDALTDFYRSRLLVPQVNPNTLARLPIRVVATIPADMAIELRAIPVALDGENNLTVAMSDPSDRHVVDEISFFTGAYVVRAVATQMQIAWCLAHYYGHVTTLGHRLLQGSGEQPVQQQVDAVATSAPRTKGLTGKVEALRHRAIAPGAPVNVIRPQSGEIALTTPEPTPAPPPPDPIVAVAEPVEDTAPVVVDGVPDKPRARSISGEIRIPGRRAPSIKPPMPEGDDDESGPVITVEVSLPDDEQTDPRKVPVRRRKAKTDPPELAARAGEVDIHSGPVRAVDEEARIIVAEDALEPPISLMAQTEVSGELRSMEEIRDPSAPSRTIEVSDEASASVIIHERLGRDDARTTITTRAPSAGDDPDDDVVVLEPKKNRARTAKPTQVGIGVLPAVTRGHRDTEAGGVPQMDEDPTGLDTPVAPRGPGESTDETDLAEPPKPSPPRARTEDRRDAGDLDDDDDDDENDRGPATAVMSAVELDEAIPQRNSEVIPAHIAKRKATPTIDPDPMDDGWGPPGTTIPPPLLGAVPGSENDAVPGRIPMSSVDSAPLIVAPPVPPEPQRGSPDATTQNSARALEDASSRMLELIRVLETAQDRDHVVDLMIDHLAETHRRAGFFVIKPGVQKGTSELSVFSIEPRPATMPFATLRLDRPSTLQDVVGTRLPYRGPMHDDASRQFMATVLGASPDEILLVPVAVRERVVGVLFGEHRMRHTFDDQLAFAARAAGMALERILKTKRG